MSRFFVSNKQLSLDNLATLLNGILCINKQIPLDFKITNIQTLKLATKDSLVFYNNFKYLDDLFLTKAGICLIEQNLFDELKAKYSKQIEHINFLIVKNSYIAFATASNIFYPQEQHKAYISQNTSIDKTATIGENAHIKDFVIIGANVKIGNNVYIASNSVINDGVEVGDNTVIHSCVSIKYARIGANCIIHDGAKIGQDGFGFAPNSSGHIKIMQIGGVIIGNNVEIGANTTIDRGALDNTEIGDGTKIDNLVQIAHNVKIGKNCFIASQVGIAGSSILEDFVFVGGGSGIAPHITIEKGKQIVPYSGVMTDIKGEPILMGYPALGKRDFFKIQVLLKKMLNNYNNKKE
jgi:UDP-3-O-[3-hydroxymyristoyl] glucosamine N-acyltransferase